MRSAILAEQLKTQREAQRKAKQRKHRREYMRQYREEQAIANVQRHPTLSNEEFDAVLEAIKFEEGIEFGRGRTDAHVFAPMPPVDPAEDARLTAEIAARSQVQPKPEDQDLESTIRVPAPPDLPNGIIR